MSEYEIVCIKKPGDPYSRTEGITSIGYVNWSRLAPTLLGGSSPFIISRQEAVEMIENNEAKFYVRDRKTNKKIPIEVINGGANGKFLRTVPDGKRDNNLLELKECKVE